MTRSPTTRQPTFWKQFALLFGLGCLGIASLIPTIIDLSNGVIQNPETPANIAQMPLPLPLLVALSLLQPAILLAIATAIGIFFARPLGLRSHLCNALTAGKSELRAIGSEFRLAAILGAVTSLVVLGLDRAIAPWIREIQALNDAMPYNPMLSVAGIFYGGITEELIMRWGLMSLLAWIGWHLLQRGRGKPHSRVMWGAIAISTLLFGLGHLPATAAIVPLTPFLILRAIALNGAGAVFGWLYWRRSLEAASIAHATSHIVAALVIGISNLF
ncbi:CPBP family intramembrane metalloprotease [Oscillatoriales cyanobacterium LEGE 11467]|uniref:CPBP family intramembrane metalloprotease n=1 Tax=Zarconia navalis LEGE 11467 TaxID=1828826 RepID=A0A928Z937_9CYAN|nr:CPBP family intramembrane glutamic endopeptidase [Zarconia navalis]MBE9042205.1 CPBP family intramembrane metalloprotease [Zarconia navalis LEGE 11467]